MPTSATDISAVTPDLPPRGPAAFSPVYFAELLLFAAAYFAAGHVGIRLHYVHGTACPVWIPTGLTLAYIWFRGRRRLPAVALGAFVLEMTLGMPWWAAAVAAAGNTLEAGTGVWLLRRAGFRPHLERVRDVVALVALPVFVGAVVSAVFGTAALATAGLLTRATAFPSLTIWWMGDALSVIVVAPLLLTWRAGGVPQPRGRSLAEGAVIFAGLAASGLFAFTTHLVDPQDFLLPALGFPFLTAAALRFGPRGTAAGVFAVAVIAVVGTARGYGPFLAGSDVANVTGLNVFLGMSGVTAMIVCALTRERRRAEQVLRTEHALFTQAEALAKIGSWQADAAGEITWGSDELHRLCGHPPGEPFGSYVAFIARYVHPDDRPRMLADAGAALAAGAVFEHRFRLVSRAGEVRHVESRGQLAANPDGTTNCIGTTQDITDRVLADHALKASEARYRLLADRATDVIARHALDGTCLYVSPSVRMLTGWPAEEIVGKKPAEFVHPDDMPSVSAAYKEAAEHPVTLTFRVRHRNGEYAWVESCGSVVIPPDGPPEVISQSRDVSERKRLEEMVQQSQKMEAIGRLAGGIAHDFNNLLTVINGFSEVLAESLPESDPNRALADEIRQAGLKAAELTKQLLAFSRRQNVTRQVLDLNEAVASSSALLGRLIGEDVRLRVTPAPGRADILADPGQIDQVVINLVMNARDAMPGGGEVTVTVSHHTARGEGEAGEMPPGEYVVLAVADTGGGIDDATKALIFEPFFTTKEQGKGTGLGLATVYGVIQQAKGRITVESEVGRGTTFRLFWPAETPAATTAAAPDDGAFALGDGEVILVVEDEAAVRALTVRLLRDRGYRVLEAADGLEALRLCEKRGSPVALVVTDVVMPHMSGRELAEKLRRLWPRVPILFLSGYTNDVILRQSIRQESAVLLTKPFSAESLLNKVRELLDAKPVRA